jgi:hypothetical protein
MPGSLQFCGNDLSGLDDYARALQIQTTCEQFMWNWQHVDGCNAYQAIIEFAKVPPSWFATLSELEQQSFVATLDEEMNGVMSYASAIEGQSSYHDFTDNNAQYLPQEAWDFYDRTAIMTDKVKVDAIIVNQAALDAAFREAFGTGPALSEPPFDYGGYLVRQASLQQALCQVDPGFASFFSNPNVSGAIGKMMRFALTTPSYNGIPIAGSEFAFAAWRNALTDEIVVTARNVRENFWTSYNPRQIGDIEDRLPWQITRTLSLMVDYTLIHTHQRQGAFPGLSEADISLAKKWDIRVVAVYPNGTRFCYDPTP